MKILIFLLFISFVLSTDRPTYRPPPMDLFNRCKGGKVSGATCICPKNKGLIGFECRLCKGGIIRFNRCYCPSGKVWNNNECRPRRRLSTKIKRNTTLPIFPLKRNTTYLKQKPVIYLYPQETMDISVNINIKKSKFTTIYPKFTEKNTWNVRAHPNGDILINDKVYPYLFWEADSYSPFDTNEGFIVSEEKAEKFLEEKLEILGLNEKEKTDFITFWLPVLLRNKLSLCSFQTKKFFDDMELNVTPKPDSLIRVFLIIKKIDEPINIKEQKLVANERKGLTVVEWGGSNF